MELERACVQGVPDIQEAAAVGVPSPGGGPEQLVLFVVPRDAGAASSNPKIKAQCQAAIRAKLNPLFKVDRVSTKSHSSDTHVLLLSHLISLSEPWKAMRA